MKTLEERAEESLKANYTTYSPKGDRDIQRLLQLIADLAEENKRWHDTHKSGDFNPDWCAASETLKEQIKARADQAKRIEELEAEIASVEMVEKVTAAIWEEDMYSMTEANARHIAEIAIATILGK